MSATTWSVAGGNQLSFSQKEFEGKTCVRPKRSSMLTSCRICLSTLFNPAALTCGHKFCEGCLDQYWQMREKPNFLICPLCRAHVYNVDFTEKDDSESVGEFRKNFSLQQISDVELNESTMTCFRISLLIPILYYLAQYLKPSAFKLFNLLKCKIWSRL